MKKLIILGACCAALFSCNRQAETEAEIEAARQSAIDSVEQAQAEERQTTIVYRETPADGTSTSASSSTSTSSSTATEEEEKKGMSNAAKGAIIGAGAGAITGAAVSKEKKGKGAIIGGVVGAAAGTATGVIIDKSKEKKEEESENPN